MPLSIDEMGLIFELQSSPMLSLVSPFVFDSQRAYLLYAPNQYFSGLPVALALKLASSDSLWWAARVPSVLWTLLFLWGVFELLRKQPTFMKLAVWVHILTNGFLHWYLLSAKGYSALLATSLWTWILFQRKQFGLRTLGVAVCAIFSHSVGAIFVMLLMVLERKSLLKTRLKMVWLALVPLSGAWLYQHVRHLEYLATIERAAKERYFWRGFLQVLGVVDAWWLKWWLIGVGLTLLIGVAFAIRKGVQRPKFAAASIGFVGVLVVWVFAFVLDAKSLDGRWLLAFLIPCLSVLFLQAGKYKVVAAASFVLLAVAPTFAHTTIWATLSRRTEVFHKQMLETQKALRDSKEACVSFEGNARKIRWAKSVYLSKYPECANGLKVVVF